MKKIYISIPISHLDYENQKTHAEMLERALSHLYEVVSPFRNGVPMDAHPSEHMRVDFKLLLDCDAIFMARGWEDSRGCVAEWTVATSCHMEVIYESKESEYYRL